MEPETQPISPAPPPPPPPPPPVEPEPISSIPPIIETPSVTPPTDLTAQATELPAGTPPITPTPETLIPAEEKGPGGGALILGGIILVVLIVGFLLFFLMRPKPAPTPRSEAQIPHTPAGQPVPPTSLSPQKFSNQFVRFEYPGNATQTKISQGYEFNLPSGNFIRYITTSLGTSPTLQSWITKNEVCGTSDTRKGSPYTNPSRLQGIWINNLGSCPGESRVVDAFYLSINKTILAFYLHTGSEKELTENEKSDFKKLIDSIILNPTTEGSK